MLTLNVRKRSTNNCCARNIVKFCIVIADTEISGKSTLFHWTVFIRRQRKWRTRRSQSWEGASRTWARSPWRNSTNRRWFRQNQKTWSAPPDQVSQIAKSNYFSLLTKKSPQGKRKRADEAALNKRPSPCPVSRPCRECHRTRVHDSPAATTCKWPKRAAAAVAAAPAPVAKITSSIMKMLPYLTRYRNKNYNILNLCIKIFTQFFFIYRLFILSISAGD